LLFGNNVNANSVMTSENPNGLPDAAKTLCPVRLTCRTKPVDFLAYDEGSVLGAVRGGGLSMATEISPIRDGQRKLLMTRPQSKPMSVRRMRWRLRAVIFSSARPM
jgi:hypothetical protein